MKNFKFQKSCFSLSENLFIYLMLYNWALYIKKLHQLDYIYIYMYFPRKQIEAPGITSAQILLKRVSGLDPIK